MFPPCSLITPTCSCSTRVGGKEGVSLSMLRTVWSGMLGWLQYTLPLKVSRSVLLYLHSKGATPLMTTLKANLTLWIKDQAPSHLQHSNSVTLTMYGILPHENVCAPMSTTRALYCNLCMSRLLAAILTAGLIAVCFLTANCHLEHIFIKKLSAVQGIVYGSTSLRGFCAVGN